MRACSGMCGNVSISYVGSPTNRAAVGAQISVEFAQPGGPHRLVAIATRSAQVQMASRAPVRRQPVATGSDLARERVDDDSAVARCVPSQYRSHGRKRDNGRYLRQVPEHRARAGRHMLQDFFVEGTDRICIEPISHLFSLKKQRSLGPGPLI